MVEKTNAIRMLDKEKIKYALYTYESLDGAIDGVSVAHKIGIDENKVYKTLITKGARELYVFIIPVHCELDLKKAAKAAGEKAVEMIAVSDINKLTGYIRGGCSPIGMKKLYKTIINNSAKELDTFLVSGGKIGLQIEISPLELCKLIRADFQEITR